MRLITIINNEQESAAVVFKDRVLPISSINKYNKKNTWSNTVFSLIQKGELQSLNDWLSESGYDYIFNQVEGVKELSKIKLGPLYKTPRKIWGIGLNYVDHAADLNEKVPSLAEKGSDPMALHHCKINL